MKWRHGHASDYDLGIEEEVMLLDPARGCALAALVDPVKGRAVAVLEIAAELMVSCAPRAAVLGCGGELELLSDLLDRPGPARQRELAARSGLVGLAAELAGSFEAPLAALQSDAAPR